MNSGRKKGWARLAAVAAVACVGLSATAAQKHLWAELLAFDAAAADYGVADYLARMPIKPQAVSFLLTDPEIVHAHRDLSRDFPIGDQECAYCARPWNEERARQPWTAWQLRGLVAELKKHGVDAYPSFFDVGMGENPSSQKLFNFTRKPGFWLDAHPEVKNQTKDGTVHSGVCIIKRLSDGTSYEDFFVGQLVRFLKDYGFAGWHACDGYGHPRSPVSDGDFSDDVVAQFAAARPEIKIPAGLSLTARADWILDNARPDWCRFYAKRHADFIGHAAAALKREGMKIILNTSWTCDPLEALYRYGEDYRLLEKAGIDGFYSEASATVLTIEGWSDPSISKLDLCRAALVRIASSVNVPIYNLACLKDGMEQYNSLRHAPSLAEAELLGLQAIFRNDHRATPDVLWCLADAVRADEWRRLDATRTLLPPPARADGVRVVWSDRAHDAEFAAYCKDRTPSSYRLLAELMRRGASVCSGVRAEEALADKDMPLLVFNPALYPADELAALRDRPARVVTFGLGAEGCELGATPADPEPTSWLKLLPTRQPSEASYARAVGEINAAAPAWPDKGMADLRVMSYVAKDGARIVVALNNRMTYLNARVRVRGRVASAKALTESPSLPVEITPDGDETVLPVKIPPSGVVVLSVR